MNTGQIMSGNTKNRFLFHLCEIGNGFVDTPPSGIDLLDFQFMTDLCGSGLDSLQILLVA